MSAEGTGVMGVISCPSLFTSSSSSSSLFCPFCPSDAHVRPSYQSRSPFRCCFVFAASLMHSVSLTVRHAHPHFICHCCFCCPHVLMSLCLKRSKRAATMCPRVHAVSEPSSRESPAQLEKEWRELRRGMML